jgi:hypothetical protein
MRLNLLAFAYTAVLALAPFVFADSKAPKAGEPVLGPASFDPQGADFTAWLNQFKDQLYEHWVPPAPPEGRRLRVNVELTVERAGAVSRVRILEGSRNADFDKASGRCAWRSLSAPPEGVSSGEPHDRAALYVREQEAQVRMTPWADMSTHDA